jgi:hypothetical protein
MVMQNEHYRRSNMLRHSASGYRFDNGMLFNLTDHVLSLLTITSLRFSNPPGHAALCIPEWAKNIAAQERFRTERSCAHSAGGIRTR